MPVKDGRWVQITESQFTHEQQGLHAVKEALPDAPPFRAWANFECRDNRGRWHEVDLLVLARDTLYLVELQRGATALMKMGMGPLDGLGPAVRTCRYRRTFMGIGRAARVVDRARSGR
jgi:hypothetical protein